MKDTTNIIKPIQDYFELYEIYLNENISGAYDVHMDEDTYPKLKYWDLCINFSYHQSKIITSTLLKEFMEKFNFIDFGFIIEADEMKLVLKYKDGN